MVPPFPRRGFSEKHHYHMYPQVQTSFFGGSGLECTRRLLNGPSALPASRGWWLSGAAVRSARPTPPAPARSGRRIRFQSALPHNGGEARVVAKRLKERVPDYGREIELPAGRRFIEQAQGPDRVVEARYIIRDPLDRVGS
jgi:hypothetical protein